MQFNKVEICGINTAKLKVLPESEKMRLLKLAQQGDFEARDKLVAGNLRLVLSVIQRFTQRGEMMDDLFQVGTIGLIKSIDNFDTNQNVRFSTYAVPTVIIRRSIIFNYLFKYFSNWKYTFTSGFLSVYVITTFSIT